MHSQISEGTFEEEDDTLLAVNSQYSIVLACIQFYKRQLTVWHNEISSWALTYSVPEDLLGIFRVFQCNSVLLIELCSTLMAPITCQALKGPTPGVMHEPMY